MSVSTIQTHLTIVTRVRSYYVHNTRTDTIEAGPYAYEANARKTLVAMEGTRFCAKLYTPEMRGEWTGCGIRYGVWDSQEAAFVQLSGEDTDYTTEDSAAAEYVARAMNDNRRNDARLRLFQQRHPISSVYR